MAMTPEEKTRLETLEKLVQSLLNVENVPFIENGKRRLTEPVITSLGLTEVISKDSTGSTAGVTQSVNEAGAGTYSVTDVPDGTLIVQDTDGAQYKLIYFTV